MIGGTSGSGLATAQALVEAGAQVLVTGRTQSKIDAAAEQLGTAATVLRSDASVVADVDTLAARIAAEYGRVDGVFVNAGIPLSRPLAEMDEATFDEIVAVNVKGPYFTVAKLAPLLNSGSAIVLTTSVANRLATPGLSAYAATKAALRAMVRTAARELLPHGIRVNAISPGPIDSGALERWMPATDTAAVRTGMTQENPMRRFGTTAEIAAAVLFLLFDATYTTGAELTVDGGAAHL
ncbi:SDR family oxidoreductase [Pseudonocardia sp. HH130630-07]|uniref:SDR family oxidoreductase n=1 Tax=Pseudonocardia sp. HH130630-07 TaxID=1690815 RepID=UPI000A8505DD